MYDLSSWKVVQMIDAKIKRMKREFARASINGMIQNVDIFGYYSKVQISQLLVKPHREQRAGAKKDTLNTKLCRCFIVKPIGKRN